MVDNSIGDKDMKKSFLPILLATTMLSAPVVAATLGSGSCGSDCQWSLGDDGILNIFGTGQMNDFMSNAATPWNSLNSSITSVNIGNGITSVGNNAFHALSNVTSITIGNSVTSIGNYAFQNMTNVTGTLVIPDSVTTIGYNAFNGLRNITGLTIGNSVTSIGNVAFANLEKVTSLTIPSSVTTIGYSAFSGMYAASGELVIPDSVTTIGNDAFKNMQHITGLKIGDSVTSIGSGAFQNMWALTGEITIPTGITDIGSNAFNGARNVTGALVIPEGVTTIGAQAFFSMNGITSVIIPDTVTSIGGYAFGGVKVPDLTVSAENLQRYLDAMGLFNQSGDINISCSSGDCKAVLEAWDATHNTTYASRAIVTAKSQQVVNADGSTSIYENGRLVATRGKRIYTVEEASKLSKPTGNTFRLRYK